MSIPGPPHSEPPRCPGQSSHSLGSESSLECSDSKMHSKLLSLPSECELWPGHLGGSLCGGPGMDMKVSSTIGYERAHNDLLRIADVGEFVHRTTSTLGPQPPNFKAVVALNRGPLRGHPVHVEP